MSKQSTPFDDFFSDIYMKYEHRVRNYIAARIRHPHEAEDLTQDTFVRLWEHQKFVNQETVVSLLFTIARNLITDKIRRYYKYDDIVYQIKHHIENEQYRNTTYEELHYRELKKKHDCLVRTLPVARRRIYALSFYNGMTCPVIADKLSLSVRTVEGQLSTARKTIRTTLQEQYLSVS